MNANFVINGVQLQTERLILRAFQQSDLDDFYEYASVEGVGEMAGWEHHQSKEESQKILDSFIEHDKTFAICLKESGKVIGSLGVETYGMEERLTEFDGYLGRELGFVLGKAYWGQGFMPEAVNGVMNYLFQEKDLDFLLCGHYDFNEQSKRVQEKCGFKPYRKLVMNTRMGTKEPGRLNLAINPNKKIRFHFSHPETLVYEESNSYEFYLTGSLEKVFPGKKPVELHREDTISIFKGEIPAVQLVHRREAGTERKKFTFVVEGFPGKPRVRDVELVPSAFPCSDRTDDNYLTTEPGLFPDLLVKKEEAAIVPLAGQYRSVWIDFPETAGISAGTYEVTVKIVEAESGEEAASLMFRVEVSDAELPEQTLIHTEWFHTDCIADYYHAEVFSERHWELVEKQIAMAADLGINMLLTPVFTPPLDTAVGGERTTVQLVDVTYMDDKWSFAFDKLEKWCEICKKHGIKYLEIAHLFTQWGAKATPKILVNTKDGLEKMFGWHVEATAPIYREFLEKFLPALQSKLIELGYGQEQVMFHISDEPRMSMLESYLAAKNVAADLLEGWKVFDALSDYGFYENGIVEHPIPSNNHIQEFIDHGVQDLWTYYCCSQTVDVPNRFFAMPSARNRIMGVLMYLYDIKGFLQWGYNFYNTSLSRFHLDPFFDTHANYAFPSGDAFLVYPGADGEPLSSLRGEVQRQGFADMRALQYLESKIGRTAVEELIHEGYEDVLFTFSKYPKDADYLYELRRKIAKKIEA